MDNRNKIICDFLEKHFDISKEEAEIKFKELNLKLIAFDAENYSLRIPDELIHDFDGRMHYRNWMEKLVWEEED